MGEGYAFAHPPKDGRRIQRDDRMISARRAQELDGSTPSGLTLGDTGPSRYPPGGHLSRALFPGTDPLHAQEVAVGEARVVGHGGTKVEPQPAVPVAL